MVERERDLRCGEVVTRGNAGDDGDGLAINKEEWLDHGKFVVRPSE